MPVDTSANGPVVFSKCEGRFFGAGLLPSFDLDHVFFIKPKVAVSRLPARAKALPLLYPNHGIGFLENERRRQ